jgi:hypothetical protein
MLSNEKFPDYSNLLRSHLPGNSEKKLGILPEQQVFWGEILAQDLLYSYMKKQGHLTVMSDGVRLCYLYLPKRSFCSLMYLNRQTAYD